MTAHPRRGSRVGTDEPRQVPLGRPNYGGSVRWRRGPCQRRQSLMDERLNAQAEIDGLTTRRTVARGVAVGGVAALFAAVGTGRVLADSGDDNDDGGSDAGDDTADDNAGDDTADDDGAVDDTTGDDGMDDGGSGDTCGPRSGRWQGGPKKRKR